MPSTLPYGSSTTLRRADRAALPTAPISLCERGPGWMRPSTYAVIDTAAASPVLGTWPLTRAGLRAATAAWHRAATLAGAVEVSA
jgi:hypothetical protein